jgi:hypothetical protein
MTAVLLGLGQYGPLAIALGLFTLIGRLWYRGDLVPKASVQAMAEAWKATDALRETARKEERDQLILLMTELRDALKTYRSAA